MFRTLAAVVAAGGLLVASALPGAAATTEVTVIDGFAASVSTVAYRQPVTFTGALLSGPSRTPVAGEPVDIALQDPIGRSALVATGTTGADGRFSITTTLPAAGYVRATFAGDTGLAPAGTPFRGTYLKPVHLPSRFVLDRAPGSVPAGTAVTFAGTFQVQLDGAWQPYPGAPVELRRNAYTTAASTTTGPDGRFSMTAAVTETASWSTLLARGGGSGSDWFPYGAAADFTWTYAVSTTRITGFRMPAKDEAHHALLQGMYATGTAQRWNGTAWVPLVYGFVNLVHRPKGSTVWRADGAAQTDGSGAFRIRMDVLLGTSDWQARVVPDADTLTSAGPVTANTVVDRTHVVSVGADRRSTWSSVYGQISDQEGRIAGFASLRGLKVRVYYRAKGSSVWHYVKASTLDTYGFFSFGVKKSRGYVFRVVLPGQGPFLGCTSRTV